MWVPPPVDALAPLPFADALAPPPVEMPAAPPLTASEAEIDLGVELLDAAIERVMS